MYFEMKDYLSFLGDTGFVDSTIGFIVIGVVLTVVSFFGICAVCTDNRCMFKAFGCIMAIVVIAEFGIAIAILICKVDAEEAISKEMRSSLNKYGNGTTNNAPDSCCKTVGTDCGKNALTSNGTIYVKGCFKTFEDSIEDNAYIVGGTGAGLGVLQILVLIGSFIL